ncbi:hypothetical protein [Zeimonas arvi]|uniref:Uncharacterized protein n=1 Tax=Zeimonas arvi TaxID=2498847 RepID=A0A5C8NST7_9BURK|nr:hypothetical protein [Zeimonas arvi]TXL63563.1 hypothetical protein FHP08_17155 [Zeimonas arvi]
MTPMQERKLYAELRGAREQRDEVQGLLRMSEAELDDTRGAVARLEAEVARLEAEVEQLQQEAAVKDEQIDQLHETMYDRWDAAGERLHVLVHYCGQIDRLFNLLLLAGQYVRAGLLTRDPANDHERAMAGAFDLTLSLADEIAAKHDEQEIEARIGRGELVVGTEET